MTGPAITLMLVAIIIIWGGLAVSVTALQWTWVSKTSRRGFTATFSCPTRSCAAAVERFLAMITTLEEI